MSEFVNFLKYLGCFLMMLLVFGVVGAYLVSLNFTSGKESKINCHDDNINIIDIFDEELYNVVNVTYDCNTYNIEISAQNSYTKSEITSMMIKAAKRKSKDNIGMNVEVLFDGYFIRLLDDNITIVP